MKKFLVGLLWLCCIVGCEPAWALEGSLLMEPAGATSGDVFYFDGKRMARSGSFNWDGVNTRLGVGTGTPVDTLDVAGPVYLRNSSPGTTTQRLYASGGQLYWAGSLLSTSSPTPPGGITGSIQFNDGAGGFKGITPFRYDEPNNVLIYQGEIFLGDTTGPVSGSNALWSGSGSLFWNNTAVALQTHLPRAKGGAGAIQVNDGSYGAGFGDFVGNSRFYWEDASSEFRVTGQSGNPVVAEFKADTTEDVSVVLTNARAMKFLNSSSPIGLGLLDGSVYRWFVNSTGDMVVGDSTTPGARLEVIGQVKITGGAPGVGKVLTSDGDGLATWETPGGGSGAVSSVFTRTGHVTAQTGDYNTDQVTEGSGNLYFTNARAQAAVTGGASSIVTSNLDLNRALVSDGSGKVAVATTTAAEVGYLSGVSSAIQTQLNTKAPLASPTFTGTVTLPDGVWSSTGVGVNMTTPLHEKLNITGRVYLVDGSPPVTTTNRLYAVGGSLFWNGVDISGGSSGAVASVFGRTGAVTAQAGDYNTSLVPEGSNLYFTDVRARGAITGAASTIAGSNLTGSRAVVSDVSGKIVASAVTSAEVGYLAGVTGAIQGQINTKASKAGDTFSGTVVFAGGGNWGSSLVTTGTTPFSAGDTVRFYGIGGTGPHLEIDGSGYVTRTTISSGGGTPGGADTQVQFNDGGSFGGDSGLVFNKSSKILTVTGPAGGNAQVSLGAVSGQNAIMQLGVSGAKAFQLRSLSTSAFDLYDTTAAASRVFVNTSGQVGIGTAAPEANALLHVHGAGGTAGVYLNDAVPTSTTGKLYKSGSDLYWSGQLVRTGSGHGDFTFNAADYGTPGTRAAIEGAIAAAHAAGGGVVFIPAGVWLLDDQISMTTSNAQRVSLLGEGAHIGGTVLRRGSNFNRSLIGINSTSETSIKRIMFDSPSVKSTYPVAHIHSYYGEGHLFEDLYLQDGYHGIQFTGPRIATLSNTRIQAYYHGGTTYGAGVWVTTAAGISNYAGLLIMSNTWVGGGNTVMYNYGMQVECVDGLQVSNCYFGENALANVVLNPSGALQLSGVYFSNSWFDAPAMTTPAGNMYGNFLVTGSSSSHYGLITIDGCMFQGKGPTGWYADFGFYVTSGVGVKGVSLTNNTFFWHYRAPVGIYGGDGYNVVGNSIMDGSQVGVGTYDGIVVDGGSKTHIASNRVGWTFSGMGTSNMRYGVAVISGDYHTIIGNNCWGNQQAVGTLYSGGSNNYVVANPPL